jgi:type III pantothenate kinase
MLMAIDAGNSTTVVGLFDGDELMHHWRMSTVARRTPDELGLLIAGMLGTVGLRLDRSVRGLVVGSVVPPVTEALRSMAARYLEVAPVVIEPGVRTGLAIHHDNPRELGADRIANAVAAQRLFGGPAVVVDFGTAISFDVVDAAGRFIGGAIAPGVGTATDALVERTARLPTIEIDGPAQIVGTSTVAALRSGVVFGFAGLVDGIVQRLVRHLGAGVTTVSTGTVPTSVLEACASLDHHDPWLTLKGLRLVWDHHHGRGS